MRNPLAIALGLAVAAGSGYFLLTKPPAAGANLQSKEEALRADAASPYKWCDVGEALLDAGARQKAEYCFRRALTLGPNIPPVWVRAANFHFRLGETREALRCSAHVLELVPDYDAILFRYYDEMVPDVHAILAELEGNKRAGRSYFRHLLATEQTQNAAITWDWLCGGKHGQGYFRNVAAPAPARDYTDDRLAAEYVAFLLHEKEYQTAAQTWAWHVGERRGDYFRTNRLFNGGFEMAPTGCDFDWKIRPSDDAEVGRDRDVARSGHWSLRVQFLGRTNVDYGGTVQTAYVTPGSYRFRAYVKTDDLTTNQGIRFRIYDPENPRRLDVETSQLTGTNDWTAVEKPITVGGDTKLVAVQVRRDASLKFDNKVAGVAWVDEVSLTDVPARRLALNRGGGVR